MRIERTPVTVYDVFGYVLPGVLIVTYILYDVGIFDKVIQTILSKSNDVQAANAVMKATWADDALIAILYFTFCYVMGQVLSYLGTFFIEDVVRAFYGAPGCYLMMTKGEQEKCSLDRVLEKFEKHCQENKKSHFMIFMIISLFLWILRLFISFFHGITLYIFKPLIGPYLYASDRYDGDNTHFPLNPRYPLKKFLRKRGIFPSKNFAEKTDNSLFLLVSSFIRYEEEAKYINNYLVLAGAMRTFSMAFLLMGWWEVGQCVFYKAGWISCYYATLHFNLFYAGFYLAISLILMLLYMKFDRRYAEEIITAVIHNNYEENKHKKSYLCKEE